MKTIIKPDRQKATALRNIHKLMEALALEEGVNIKGEGAQQDIL